MNDTEFGYRRNVFTKNLDIIKQHNLKYAARQEAFKLGVNHLTHLTFEEFQRNWFGYKDPRIVNDRLKKNEEQKQDGKGFNIFGPIESVFNSFWYPYPTVKDDGMSFDHRESGCIGEVRNQKKCGSCYAFTSADHFDSQECLCNQDKSNRTVRYSSPQNLVDCSSKQGNNGCNGGLMDNCVNYAKQTPGLNLESDYPYTGTQDTCNFNKETAIHRNITEIKHLKPDENVMMEYIKNGQPLMICVKADQKWQLYEKGILGETKDFAARWTRCNHAVNCVGYGYDAILKKHYWLVCIWSKKMSLSRCLIQKVL